VNKGITAKDYSKYLGSASVKDVLSRKKLVYNKRAYMDNSINESILEESRDEE
jgi:hypothetical protein